MCAKLVYFLRTRLSLSLSLSLKHKYPIMPRISALDMPDVPKGQLPPHLELQRTRVFCASDAPTHVFIFLNLIELFLAVRFSVLFGYFVSNCIFLDFFSWCLKTERIQSSGAYVSMGVDNSLRLDQFCNNFKVEVVRLTEDEMEFDMINIDPSIANAFRRILISEVCASVQ